MHHSLEQPPDMAAADAVDPLPERRPTAAPSMDSDVEKDFAAFVRARRQSLVGFAFLLSGSYDDAQDLVQTALAKAYLRWRKLNAHGTDAYVRKIIVHEHASIWRRAWRRRERSTGDLEQLERAMISRGERAFGRDDNSGRLEDQTWQRVLQLPKRQRAVIALRFYEDLSVADTAELLGCSTGTIKSQTSRALTALRNAIDADAGRVDRS